MRTVDDKVVVALHQIRDAIKNKECCNGGGESSDSSSKEVTIDDIVKFIHDDIENVAPGRFPYTTWNEIPDRDDVEDGEICKNNGGLSGFASFMLSTASYTIGIKAGKFG